MTPGKWRTWRKAFFTLVSGVSLIAAAETPSPAVIQIGAAYVAKQYCSCLLVTGRSASSCHAEFKPNIDLFTVTIDRSRLPRAATVTLRAGQAISVVKYSRRFGCMIAR